MNINTLLYCYGIPSSISNMFKPDLQSRALCGNVFALSIANSILLNGPIVSLMILFYFI